VSGAAWLCGMLTAFRLNSVQSNVGDGEEFEFIIAAVVGGNLLTGGYGSAAGGAIGSLIMSMSTQGIPFSGWNTNWRYLFLGVILLLAVAGNNWVRTKAATSRRA
jgi:simple sugar transport system permease protein